MKRGANIPPGFTNFWTQHEEQKPKLVAWLDTVLGTHREVMTKTFARARRERDKEQG